MREEKPIGFREARERKSLNGIFVLEIQIEFGASLAIQPTNLNKRHY